MFPVELDGQHGKVDCIGAAGCMGFCGRFLTWTCEGKIKLIRLFVQHPWVRIVYFNDPEAQKAVGRVSSCAGHHDHFHVELWTRFAS